MKTAPDSKKTNKKKPESYDLITWTPTHQNRETVSFWGCGWQLEKKIGVLSSVSNQQSVYPQKLHKETWIEYLLIRLKKITEIIFFFNFLSQMNNIIRYIIFSILSATFDFIPNHWQYLSSLITMFSIINLEQWSTIVNYEQCI